MLVRMRGAGQPYYPELERLVCMALSNPLFAMQLIKAPERALEQFEYANRLSSDERAIVAEIQDAKDLSDFAAQLYDKVQQLQANIQPIYDLSVEHV